MQFQLGWIIVLLLLAGCSGTSMKDAKSSANKDSFLALGDSYTIGESVAESERWPTVLAKRLKAKGIAISEPTIIARTGWTTDELQSAVEAAKPVAPFP